MTNNKTLLAMWRKQYEEKLMDAPSFDSLLFDEDNAKDTYNVKEDV